MMAPLRSQPPTPQTPRHRYLPVHQSDRRSSIPSCSQGLTVDGSQVALLPPPKGRGEQKRIGNGILIWGKRRVVEEIKGKKGRVIIWAVGVGLLVWSGMVIGGRWGKKLGFPMDGAGGMRGSLDVETTPLPQTPPEHHYKHEPTTTIASLSAGLLSQLPSDNSPRAVLLHDPSPTGANYKWALYLPPSLTYPLPPHTYSQLLISAHSAAENASLLNHPSHQVGHSHSAYYHTDEAFLDPARFSPPTPNTCERTLTYYLRSSYPAYSGMGISVMGLWLAYGLAKYENRTFFIEDEGWIWGNFSTYFHPISKPNCLPPPMNVRVPYPHSANHLILMPETNSEMFGHAFVDEFEVASAQGVFRQERIFGLVRRGYEDLFTLNSEDEKLVNTSVTEAWTIADAQFGVAKLPSSGGGGTGERVYTGGMVVLHIRHGEAARPREYWYSKGYLPLERYVDVSLGLIGGEDGPDEGGQGGEDEDGWGPVMVISDDPGVWEEEEMKGAWKAQVEMLPWKFKGKGRVVRREGGEEEEEVMVAGNPPRKPPPLEKKHPYGLATRRTVEVQSLPGFSAEGLSKLSMQERAVVGRGYLFDLKIAGELAAQPGERGGGGVVCGGYSTSCRLLGVMMGWERGIMMGRWRDVDGWVWQGEDQGRKKRGMGGEWRGWVW